MNELQFLKNETIENKILNFYNLYNINLFYIKTIKSYSVDRYFFKILNNAKLKKIENLINELELYIEAEKIKIDFEKTSGCVVFEISKKKRKTLYFSELENDDIRGVTASIGKTTNNKEVSIDLTEAPHLLIAGSTGSGKSCILNDIIVSLLNKYDKDYMNLILIDMKQVEFTQYKSQKQLVIPIVTDIDKTNDILNKMLFIVQNRYKILSQKNYKNIKEYNKNEKEKLCYYIIIIDELADLFMQNRDIENILCRLLQIGRACGVHFILATQRPDVQTINGTLKVNIPTRLALAVTNEHDSKTILNCSGAEKLIGKGDFLLKKSNGDIVRGQAAYINNVQEVLKNE